MKCQHWYSSNQSCTDFLSCHEFTSVPKVDFSLNLSGLLTACYKNNKKCFTNNSPTPGFNKDWTYTKSSTKLNPPVWYCAGSPCAAKTAPTHQDTYTRLLGIYDGNAGMMFLQVPQMFYQIGIGKFVWWCRVYPSTGIHKPPPGNSTPNWLSPLTFMWFTSVFGVCRVVST